MAEDTVSTLASYRFEPRVCPICGSNDRKTLGHRGGSAHHRGLGIEVTIVRCSACNHIYPFPFPLATNFSELYGDPATYFQEHDVIEKQRQRAGIIVELERLLGKPGHLLEVGSGCGELLAAAMERGWTAIGIDTAEQFCDYARSIYGVEVINSALTADLFEPQSFDAVTLAAVLEHVEAPIDLLGSIARVLKPGGVLFLDVPNEGSPAVSLVNLYFRLRGRDWAVQLAPTFPPYHIQGFSPKSLAFALDRTGFDIISLITYGVGNQGFRPQSRSQSLEALVWLVVDRVSLTLGQGTGLLTYASRR